MTSNLRPCTARDHRAWLLTCALLACASDPLDSSPDAGAECDGGIVGPLGSCITDEQLDAGPPVCAPPGARCHTARDCCDALNCLAPGEVTCGACRRVEDECGESQPCPDGALCVTEPPPPCACEQREAHRCQPDCRVSGCAEDERCRGDGVCEPIPCDDGFNCAPGLSCVPGTGDRHGCMPRPCRDDRGCPPEAPFCVGNACREELGQCSFPRP